MAKIFKPLEFMEKKYSIDAKNYISSGDSGRIYELGDGQIVKIPYNPFNKLLRNDIKSQLNLFKEYKNQDLVTNLGLKFPKPEGVFAVKETESGRYYPGLVMEYKKGKTLDKLDDGVLKKAREKRDLEIEKAKNMGIIFKDNHKNNALWLDGLEDICLLDAADIQIN